MKQFFVAWFVCGRRCALLGCALLISCGRPTFKYGAEGKLIRYKNKPIEKTYGIGLTISIITAEQFHYQIKKP